MAKQGVDIAKQGVDMVKQGVDIVKQGVDMAKQGVDIVISGCEGGPYQTLLFIFYEHSERCLQHKKPSHFWHQSNRQVACVVTNPIEI